MGRAGLLILGYLLVAFTALVFVLAFRSGRGSLGHTWVRALLALVALAATAASLTLLILAWQASGRRDPLGLYVMILALLPAGSLCLLFWGLFFFLGAAPRVGGTPEEEAGRARVRSLVVLALAGALLALGVTAMLRQRARPSHERTITLLSLSFDESEVLSRDSGGTVKRWRTSSGRYLGGFDNPSIAEDASALQSGPDETLLVQRREGRDEFYAGFAAKHFDSDFGGHPSRFTPAGEVLTVERGACIEWSSPRKVRLPLRRFCWPLGILDVAGDESGAAHALNQARNVMTVAGVPPVVSREVRGGGRNWRRILAEPGGTVVVVDDKGRGGVVLAGETALREIPEAVRLDRVGFLAPTTLVYGENELRVLDLVTLESAPYAEAGGSVLVASPKHGRTVVARGKDLYMIGLPVAGGATPARRLRPWFF